MIFYYNYQITPIIFSKLPKCPIVWPKLPKHPLFITGHQIANPTSLIFNHHLPPKEHNKSKNPTCREEKYTSPASDQIHHRLYKRTQQIEEPNQQRREIHITDLRSNSSLAMQRNTTNRRTQLAEKRNTYHRPQIKFITDHTKKHNKSENPTEREEKIHITGLRSNSS